MKKLATVTDKFLGIRDKPLTARRQLSARSHGNLEQYERFTGFRMWLQAVADALMLSSMLDILGDESYRVKAYVTSSKNSAVKQPMRA